VEPERPGTKNLDNGSNSNFFTVPAEVFLLNDNPPPTPDADDEIYFMHPTLGPIPHATYVAGVMISGDTFALGVAPSASLYASASAFRSENPVFDTDELTAQFVAMQDNGEVRAINISYIIPYDPGGIPDGNSSVTQFVDWSASEHDVLYVAANRELPLRPQSTGQPTDNFNGMTVAFSRKFNGAGAFRQVDPDNDFSGDAFGERTSIDILAPGRNIQVPDLGGGTPPVVSGTSYAAPHVTGTVAILQQYAEIQIGQSAENWDRLFEGDPTAHRHEVMKAVLMNSVDKFIDNGTVLHPVTSNPIPQGRLLGMERTVLKQLNDTWFQSEAYLELDDPLFDDPLDEEMGTGHLNAKRALQQFIPGEHELNGNYGEPTVGDVPHIGWDFGTISTPPSFPINKYRIEGTLEAGHFFSATLAWDRTVEFASDADMYGEFDDQDTFEDYTDLSNVLQNLDLYLVPANTNDIGENDILVSQSSVTPVEHIFGEIPETGEYELWVYRNEDFVPDQNYGLAWWYGLAPEIEPPTVSGDFDNDGDADGRDFLVWQRGGSPTPFSPGDLADWQAGYGSPLSAVTAVPEPSSLVVALLFGSVMILRCRV
jgi:hypothetical protein